jgi:hypothetical protein
MKTPERITLLILGILSALFGILSFPIGSSVICDSTKVTLFIAIAAISIAVLTLLSLRKGEEQENTREGWGLKSVWLGTLVAIVLGNVKYPWAAITLAIVAIIGGSIVSGLQSRWLPGNVGARAYAIAGILLGLQGVVYFGYTKISPYHYTAINAKHDAEGLARIEEGQKVQPVGHEITVDLSPYMNTRLNESFFHNAAYYDSYVSLPAGRQVLGGVLFDVEGIVLFSGQLALKHGINNYPSNIVIQIGRKCKKFNFLNGLYETTNAPVGENVGDITFTYSDGSEWRIPLQSQVNDGNKIGLAGETFKDKAAEVVWVGTNGITEAVKQMAPWVKLRAIKTTIVNPHPDLEVASLTYESLMHEPSPFLISLTLDE